MRTNIEREIDRDMLQQAMLDDIIFEIVRRGNQILYGNGLGLRGRVLFIPASTESMHEREETGSRNVPVSEDTKARVGKETERQGVHDLDAQGDESSEGGERSGPASTSSINELADRMQGRKRTVNSVQPSKDTSTPIAAGVQTTAPEEEKGSGDSPVAEGQGTEVPSSSDTN